MFDKNGKVKNGEGRINAMKNNKTDDALPRWNSIIAHNINALSRKYSQVRITFDQSNVEPDQEEGNTRSDPAHVSLAIHTLISAPNFFTLSCSPAKARRAHRNC